MLKTRTLRAASTMADAPRASAAPNSAPLPVLRVWWTRSTQQLPRSATGTHPSLITRSILTLSFSLTECDDTNGSMTSTSIPLAHTSSINASTRGWAIFVVPCRPSGVAILIGVERPVSRNRFSLSLASAAALSNGGSSGKSGSGSL